MLRFTRALDFNLWLLKLKFVLVKLITAINGKYHVDLFADDFLHPLMIPKELVQDLETGSLSTKWLAHRSNLRYAWDGVDQFGLHEFLHVDGHALSLEDVGEILN